MFSFYCYTWHLRSETHKEENLKSALFSSVYSCEAIPGKGVILSKSFDNSFRDGSTNVQNQATKLGKRLTAYWAPMNCLVQCDMW